MKIKTYKKNILMLFLFLPLTVHAKWESTIKIDEMTDEKTGAVIATSTKGKGWIGKPYSAVVRCNSSDYTELDVYVNWGQFMSSHASDYVQYRFDKETTFKVDASLSTSTNGSASFISPVAAEKIFKLMKEKNVMRVKTTNFGDVSTQVGVFPLGGFTSAYNNACGWWVKERASIK